MSKRFVGLILMLVLTHDRVETAYAQNSLAQSINVECHGKLRCGKVAVGGEATGTTIAFDRVIWELNLQDEASKKFAESHHKEAVSIKGKLRRVAGTERQRRWIVDVSHIQEPVANAEEQFGIAIICGKLQKHDGLLVISANEITWPIDVSLNADLKAKADSLMAKTVFLKGKIERVDGASLPVQVRIKAESLEQAPIITNSKHHGRSLN